MVEKEFFYQESYKRVDKTKGVYRNIGQIVKNQGGGKTPRQSRGLFASWHSASHSVARAALLHTGRVLGGSMEYARYPGGDATNYDAVQKIFDLKKRKDSKTMICLVNSNKMLNQCVEEIPETAYKILKYANTPTTIIYDRPLSVSKNLITRDSSRRYLTRPQILKEISKKNRDSQIVQQQEMPRDDQWKSRTEYVFSISPVGAGLDCHRTWESLMLGQIVIVQSSPLDPLFEGLPVVIVKNWDEVTQENLEIWIERYSDATTNPEFRKRLTFKYWYNKTHDFSQQHAKVETNNTLTNNPLYNLLKIINIR